MKPLTAAMVAVRQNAELLRGASGQDGKDGNPGTEGKATTGLTWRGTFAYGQTYQPGDVVEWEGSSYVALVVTARRPPDPEWDLLAAKGEPGASGRGYIRGGGGSGSGSALAASDEGVPLTAAATSFDFAGAGVTATAVGTAVTVTVPGGGVTDADYLVGTAHAGLSAEIVVGASPGGELGGTWGAPTVDATHSGSTHAATQAAAESTAAGALTTHAGAADPHTGYRLESADHTHASTGAQAGKIAQASSHESPDTDAGTSSLHHTIGGGANQAAAGNHSHAGGAIQSVTVDLDEADILALNSTPVVVVPAPGAGFATHPIASFSEIVFGTEAYSFGPVMKLRYDGFDDFDAGELAAIHEDAGYIRFDRIKPDGSVHTTDAENKAIVIRTTEGDLVNYGSINASSLNAGGAAWLVGDTFAVQGGGQPGTALGEVDTVSLGAVVTYHLTNNGTSYQVATGVTCNAGFGSIGTDLTIDINSITTLGDGTYRITVEYAVIALA